MLKTTQMYKKALQKISIKLKNHFINYLVLKNVYHTHYNRKVLILYIVGPFFNKNWTHTNQQIAIEIAEVFKDKGYNVDVAQYTIRRKINFHNYNVIFGFGEQFDRLLREFGDSTIKTIAFLTGASAYYANVAELRRLTYFKERNRTTLMLRRQDHESDGLMDLAALQNATAAICTGNMWTVNTWKNMISNIHPITATGFDCVKLNEINRDVKSAKRNFLWFSGAGMLHKGLDLCIEAFRDTPDLNLYVAGMKDSDFYDFYEEDFKRPNIHYYGFIDVKSEEYKELCTKCLFCIFPSCSEGGASSVLTTMFSGMIPVVTKEASVDIQDWGIKIGEINVSYLKELIKSISEMEDSDLKIREENAYMYAMKNHSIEKFRDDFSEILDSILY